MASSPLIATPARPAAASPAPAPRSTTAPASAPAKRARKDRGPNWLPQEVMALVNAKREMHLEEMDTVDARDLMNADSRKWQRVSEEVMKCGFSPCTRDATACKTKWNQIVLDYKRIADFFARTGRNGADYWDLTTSERKTKGLPRSFSQLFHGIHEWFWSRPSMHPPHTRDLLSPDDGNYQNQRSSVAVDDQVQDSEDKTEDPMEIAAEVEGTNYTSSHTPSGMQGHNNDTTCGVPKFGNMTPPVRHRSSLPPSVTLHVISSSDTSDSNGKRCTGNTAVKRKSLSGHTLIAEATRASGEVLARQMREMAEVGRDIERPKIEVQLKLFMEQMQYQREIDLKLHESSCIANENARLAILKQNEVVQCLTQLSSVLSMGLRLSNGRSAGSEPELAPPNVVQEVLVPSNGPPIPKIIPHHGTTDTTGGKANPDTV